MGLCLYFLTVFEGDADIVSAVDGGMVHQRMPVFDAELGERIWHFLKGFKEGFNVGSLQLHLLKLSMTVSKRSFAVSNRCVRLS